MTLVEFFADRKKWTQGQLARDRTGKYVNSTSPEAVCWCLLGAMSVVYPNRNDNYAARNKIAEVTGYDSMLHFNDSVEYEEFMSALVKAGV